MKSAPFTILPVLYTAIIAGVIFGGLIGALMGGSGISQVLIGTLCGFIPLAIGGWLRTQIVGLLASSKGIDGPVQYAFPLSVRLIIALVISLIVAYVTLDVLGYSVSAITGMLMGLFSALAMITIMSVRMMTK